MRTLRLAGEQAYLALTMDALATDIFCVSETRTDCVYYFIKLFLTHVKIRSRSSCREVCKNIPVGTSQTTSPLVVMYVLLDSNSRSAFERIAVLSATYSSFHDAFQNTSAPTHEKASFMISSPLSIARTKALKS